MYAIVRRPHYYAGTYGPPSNTYLTDDDGNDILTFASREDAQQYIDDNLTFDGPYYLAHGEYAAPDYEIVDLDAQIDCVQVYQPGDKWRDRLVITEERIPLPIRAAVVGGNVDYEDSDGAVEDWTYSEEYNGNTYGITYFVRTEASQRAGLTGDMSNVDWDSPVYWVEYDIDEMTVAAAAAYAAEVGQPVTGRNIRHAAKAGHIPGARKIGRDWLIPYTGMSHYLDNRPKRGPKPQ